MQENHDYNHIYHIFVYSHFAQCYHSLLGWPLGSPAGVVGAGALSKRHLITKGTNAAFFLLSLPTFSDRWCHCFGNTPFFPFKALGTQLSKYLSSSSRPTRHLYSLFKHILDSIAPRRLIGPRSSTGVKHTHYIDLLLLLLLRHLVHRMQQTAH